jgi:hypothetical protein
LPGSAGEESAASGSRSLPSRGAPSSMPWRAIPGRRRRRHGARQPARTRAAAGLPFSAVDRPLLGAGPGGHKRHTVEIGTTCHRHRGGRGVVHRVRAAAPTSAPQRVLGHEWNGALRSPPGTERESYGSRVEDWRPLPSWLPYFVRLRRAPLRLRVDRPPSPPRGAGSGSDGDPGRDHLPARWRAARRPGLEPGVAQSRGRRPARGGARPGDPGCALAS